MVKNFCETSILTKEVVTIKQEEMKSKNLHEVKDIFKILADETRLKIIYVLSKNDNICVCDVALLTNCTIATASHHLRTLKSKGLAKSKKQGKQMLYSIDDNHVKQLIEMAIVHQQEVSNRGKK